MALQYTYISHLDAISDYTLLDYLFVFMLKHDENLYHSLDKQAMLSPT